MAERKDHQSNFIFQGSILAVAGIISRIIGLLYRMPLQKTIGDAGMGYYSAAFQIYSLMLIISSYSLPVAVSKLVSARVSKGQYRNARRVYKGALCFAFITGGAVCLVTFFCADMLSVNIMHLGKCAIALRMLAPTLLVVAVMGVMRGYFQGLGTMMPTAASQLVEQIVNAVVSVSVAVYLTNYGEKVAALLRDAEYKPAWGAAGGTIGTGAGAIAGLLVLMILMLVRRKTVKRNLRKDISQVTDSYGKVFRVIIVTVLPVILSTTIYNISDTLDQIIFNFAMDSKGLSAIKAEYWGMYSTKYRVLTNVPIALANALCSSMMPSLTASIERREFKQARRKVASCIRFNMILSIPCAVGLAVLGKPIIACFFSGEVDMPANMLRFGSVSVIFYALSTMGNGVLQGIDKMRIPVRNAAISLVLHLGILFLCVQVFDWKLYGVVISCISFALIMCILNWLSIRKYLHYRQEIARTFIIPLISSLIMGVFVWLTYFLLAKKLSDVIAMFASVAVGAFVYFVVLLLLKGVRENEILGFPGGRFIVKIAKVFHLV